MLKRITEDSSSKDCIRIKLRQNTLHLMDRFMSLISIDFQFALWVETSYKNSIMDDDKIILGKLINLENYYLNNKKKINRLEKVRNN